MSVCVVHNLEVKTRGNYANIYFKEEIGNNFREKNVYRNIKIKIFSII